MSKEYKFKMLSAEALEDRFAHTAKYIKPDNFKQASPIVFSPSGNYSLTVEHFSTGEGTWSYTCGIVKNKVGDILFRINRNYSSFWHSWVTHANGHEYLLCGEDYQGYTVVDLTANKLQTCLGEEAIKGCGFCWVEAIPSPDGRFLAVNGCYWAFPFDVRIYDFSNPDVLPLPFIHISECTAEDSQFPYTWVDNTTFKYTSDIKEADKNGKDCSEMEMEELEKLKDEDIISTPVWVTWKYENQKFSAEG